MLQSLPNCGHIRDVYEEGELARDSVVANFATTAADGKTQRADYYSLDVNISVGYRVRSRHPVPHLGHRAPVRVPHQGSG